MWPFVLVLTLINLALFGLILTLYRMLQRQSKDFLQNLTVEVAASKNSALVYSLQWSAREALGNIALLEEIDHLTSRKDQLREPVVGDEVLRVLQRRLLGGDPPEDAAKAVAEAYSDVVVGMWRAHAETPGAKSVAEEKGIQLEGRLKSSYPFHPAMIDVMKDRWSGVELFTPHSNETRRSWFELSRYRCDTGQHSPRNCLG